MSSSHDPFVPWQNLRPEVLGRKGLPISVMTLHRWRDKGVIEVHNIGGRNYVRLRETLNRIGAATDQTAS